MKLLFECRSFYILHDILINWTTFSLSKNASDVL